MAGCCGGARPRTQGTGTGAGSRAGSGPAVAGGPRRRIALFAALSAATVVLAAALLRPGGGAGTAEASVTITMGGFSSRVLTARAGQPMALELVNPDSAFHTDGGGWHQLAIPALGVDGRVAPKSRAVVELPAAAPGEYPFYCDVCCGGKENPTMQGVLRVV